MDVFLRLPCIPFLLAFLSFLTSVAVRSMVYGYSPHRIMTFALFSQSVPGVVILS